jgi:hypothetical protein
LDVVQWSWLVRDFVEDWRSHLERARNAVLRKTPRDNHLAELEAIAARLARFKDGRAFLGVRGMRLMGMPDRGA